MFCSVRPTLSVIGLSWDLVTTFDQNPGAYWRRKRLGPDRVVSQTRFPRQIRQNRGIHNGDQKVRTCPVLENANVHEGEDRFFCLPSNATKPSSYCVTINSSLHRFTMLSLCYLQNLGTSSSRSTIRSEKLPSLWLDLRPSLLPHPKKRLTCPLRFRLSTL